MLNAVVASKAAASGTVVLLQGGESHMRYCSDHEPIFRQESYFSYLFGVTEPGFYGALDVCHHPEGNRAVSHLFMPRLPDSYAVWMGQLHTPDYFKAKYDVDHVHYVDEMPAVLRTMGCRGHCTGETGMCLPTGDDGSHSATNSGSGSSGRAFPPTLLLLRGLNTDSGATSQPASFKGMDEFPVDYDTLHPLLSECRVIKSKEEIRVLRYAAAVSSDAHVQVMRSARPGMMEYELEAEFLHHCHARGGCRMAAYTCICACGPNSSVLHYGHAAAPNDRQLADGDLALLDMGAEYFCYGADITCSFPVNGKFSPEHQIVYEAVLDAQSSVIQGMRPGIKWPDMHRLAEERILHHLLSAGLLRGSLDEMMAAHLGAVFMPHGLGHFLGLDTHDVGGYNGGVQRSQEPGLRSLRTVRTLEAGMVITVEPGCYFIDVLLDAALADPVHSHFLVPHRVNSYRGTGGVRLEDDVVVTPTGVENLTKCPRSVSEVEHVMAGGTWPSALDLILNGEGEHSDDV